MKKVQGKKYLTRRRNGKVKVKKSIKVVTLNRQAKLAIKEGYNIRDSRGKVKRQYLSVATIHPPRPIYFPVQKSDKQRAARKAAPRPTRKSLKK